MGLALFAGLVTWLLGRHMPEERVVTISAVTHDEAPVGEAERTLPRQSMGAAIRAAAPVVCPEQSIAIVIVRQSPRTSCMGRTRTIQNGNVRTYRVEGQDRDAPVMSVEAAGESILRARLAFADGRTFACLRDKCGGISIGPHDSQGARSVRFRNASLANGEDTAVVNATFRTTPDDQLASTTCVGQLLTISVGEGTVHFCPDSGSGFQLEDDGSIAYRFMNGDGNTVAVRLGREGALQSVEYGAFICRSPNCVGTSVSPGELGERRNFVFQGTVLTERNAGATAAILNGNLVLAPQ